MCVGSIYGNSQITSERTFVSVERGWRGRGVLRFEKTAEGLKKNNLKFEMFDGHLL